MSAYKINGIPVTREQFVNYKSGEPLVPQQAEAPRIGDWKELHSDMMAWDGNIEDAKRIDRELGAPYVDYDGIGRPIFKSKETWNRWLKAHGKVNKTSGGVRHTISAADLERAIARAKS